MSENGFWSVVKRLIVGETAIRTDIAPKDKDAWNDAILPEDEITNESDRTVTNLDAALPASDDGNAVTNRYIDSHGQKIRPELLIEHCEPKLHGDRVDIWAFVRNESDFALELDRIEVLGQHREFKQFFNPGQTRQLLIYSGPIPHNGGDHKAKAYYKITETTDAFRADYYVKYEVEHDGSFLLEELDLMRPVNDI